MLHCYKFPFQYLENPPELILYCPDKAQFQKTVANPGNGHGGGGGGGCPTPHYFSEI